MENKSYNIIDLPEPSNVQMVESKLENRKKVLHTELIPLMLKCVTKVDFRELAGIKNDSQKIKTKHYLICCIENVIKLANQNNWGLCKHDSYVYLFNGEFWSALNKDELETFLGQVAEKMGIDKYDAKHYQFKECLVKQFYTEADLGKPNPPNEVVNINLNNGTFVITPNESVLKPFDKNDFLKYKLDFDYNPNAIAPMFMQYLNKVQPDTDRQNILAEYIAFLFVRHSTLKLEKTLLLYGTGANGKSVFFEIMSALLGQDNISNFSLQNLTNENGYYRAKLANKLVNYASEIGGKLEASFFKQLVSGEPVEARAPYQEPFTLTNYAKLIFNCNELPKDVEQTPAFFRRFLIVPFDVTIKDGEQDKELSKKITQHELSGVFNWVLAGLKRLLIQKNFSHSKVVDEQLELYKRESDSVQMFLEDGNFVKSSDNIVLAKDIYKDYKEYCIEDGYRPCSAKTFNERLKKLGYIKDRKNYGYVYLIEKKQIV